MTGITTIFSGAEDVRRADALIRPYLRETALERAHLLEPDAGTTWLKLESQQHTGSFKVRGALHAIMAMSDEARSAGVVTASSGNHGLGVAYAAEKLGVPATIFLPEDIDESKLERIERFDVEIRRMGKDCGESEKYARDVAEKTGRRYVSPYNDAAVVAGQGTIGLEILRQLPELETVIVSVGGGGLLAGISAYLKAVKPSVQVVAVSPANSPVMFDELMNAPDQFRILKPTISDGTAGSIDPSSITVDLCRALIDEWVLVEESEICEAIDFLFQEHRLIVEGAGALPVAAYRKEKERYQESNTALIICGGNISIERFRGVVGV